MTPGNGLLLVGLLQRNDVRPVHDVLLLHAGETIDEAEQAVGAVECARGNATDALRDFENAGRHDVGELVPPRLPLQGDAGTKLLECAQRPNVDVHALRFLLGACRCALAQSEKVAGWPKRLKRWERGHAAEAPSSPA